MESTKGQLIEISIEGIWLDFKVNIFTYDFSVFHGLSYQCLKSEEIADVPK